MLNFNKSVLYNDDLETSIQSTVNIMNLANKSIMITGATGLIGSFIVDMLLKANELKNANIKIYAISRNAERLKNRFNYAQSPNLICVESDIIQVMGIDAHVDYIIHAASNACPEVFDTDPVGTMLSNISGTNNLLQYGLSHGAKRLLFVSSGEVYGKSTDPALEFEESYSGYVDPLLSRSCYPSSKRAAETLCVSFTKQFGLDTVIARPCHIYGPNTTPNDNRASAQFFQNALNKQNIVLKSPGTQLRSYCYVADCASAILTILLNGTTCQAYNVANSNSIATIAHFAQIVSQCAKLDVHHDYVTAEFSPPQIYASNQVLCNDKLLSLGFHANYDLAFGISKTYEIIKFLK